VEDPRCEPPALSNALLAEREAADKARAEASRREAELRAVLQAVTGIIFVTDGAGTIVQANALAASHLGFDPVGQRLDDAMVRAGLRLGADGGEPFRKSMASRPAALPDRMPARLEPPGGTPVHVLISAAPVSGLPGETVITMVEVTERVRAERVVQDRLRLAQQAARIGSFEWNLGTGVNRWTPELEAMYGLPPGGFPGTEEAWEQLVHPEDRAGAQAVAERALATGLPVEGEWRVIWPDGTLHWFMGRCQAFKDEAGQPRRLIGVNIDITERKRTEQALRESEERLRLFIENAPAAIAMFDRNMCYLAVSRRWMVDYGLGDRAILGRSHYDVFSEIPDIWKAAHQRGLAGEVVQAAEDRFERADGATQWLRWEVRPWHREDRAVGGIIIFTEDITERKQAEEALRKSEERLKTIADAIPQLAWMAQPDGFIFWYNQRWYEYTGTTPEQMEGWGWQSVHDPEILPSVLARWKEAIATGVPFEMDFPLRGADGRFRWFLTRVTPAKDSDGRVWRWFGTNTNISERKQAEEERERLLKENEGLAEAAQRRNTELSTIIDSIADAVFVSDDRGVITLVNRAGLELTGADRQEARLTLADYLRVLQLRFLEGGRPVPLEDLAIARAVQGETVRGREEVGIHPVTGQRVDLLVSAAPVRDESGRIVGAVEVAADVTERRRAERALRESAERLRLAQQVARVGSFEWNIQAGVNRWTPELEAMYGLPPGGFAGTQPAWEELVHPEDRPNAVEAVRYALETGIPVETEWQVVWPDGSVHWLAGRFQASRDEAGNLLSLAGVNIDITERKRAESQRVELVREQTALAEASRRAAELEAANRELEAANRELEAFSYSVSHDLRAPLRTIDGFSLSLLKGYSDRLDERGSHLLARVRAASQRMGTLIDDILTLSRVTRREMRWEPVELSSLAQAVVAELRQASPERQVEIHIEPGLKARGDPELLRVVLTNLLGNAWKFSGKREHATIEFGITRKNGEWIYYVKDNGAGFDRAYAGKLFGAFQRLHSESEFPGTGIGLATVQRIVHRHGGQVCGEGEVEKGATFCFTLGSRPAARTRPEGSSLEGSHG
jgi:PAS domain S-box-containing protein